jgi:hypothetical protein
MRTRGGTGLYRLRPILLPPLLYAPQPPLRWPGPLVLRPAPPMPMPIPIPVRAPVTVPVPGAGLAARQSVVDIMDVAATTSDDALLDSLRTLGPITVRPFLLPHTPAPTDR